MVNFGVLLICKNNYELTELFLKSYDYKNILVLILDLNSKQEQIALGKKVCSKYGASMKSARSSNMHDNIEEAIMFFQDYNINWLLFCHQDAYPLSANWSNCLSEFLNTLIPGQQGIIGFNVYHDHEIEKWQVDAPRLMTTARAPLELGNGYYDSRPGSRVNYDKFDDSKPFLVETPFWSSVVIDAHSFKNHVKADFNFNFFHAFDDIAFQFLKNNVPNIVYPRIHFAHDQSLKLKVGLHKNSSTSGSKQQIEALYGRVDHLLIWEQKWEFKYQVGKRIVGDNYLASRIIDKVERFINVDLSSGLETIARDSFRYDADRVHSLIDRFYSHDPKTGPLEYFNP